MTARSNNPSEKARELHEGLFADAKRWRSVWYAADPLWALRGDGSPRGRVFHGGSPRACDARRPSVSRVLEIGMHGLKGGIRNPGSQEHRA
jgi:hypothetical protein